MANYLSYLNIAVLNFLQLTLDFHKDQSWKKLHSISGVEMIKLSFINIIFTFSKQPFNESLHFLQPFIAS